MPVLCIANQSSPLFIISCISTQPFTQNLAFLPSLFLVLQAVVERGVSERELHGPGGRVQLRQAAVRVLQPAQGQAERTAKSKYDSLSGS